MRFAYYLLVLSRKFIKDSDKLLSDLAMAIGVVFALFLLITSALLALISSPEGDLSSAGQAFVEKYGYDFLPYIPTSRDFIGEYPLPCSTDLVSCDYGGRVHPITGH